MQKFKYHVFFTTDFEHIGDLVQLPNLENTYTEGETLLESVKHAEEVLESMLIDYNDKFNPPSPVSEITIAKGESLVAVEVNVTPNGTTGDVKRKLVNENRTKNEA